MPEFTRREHRFFDQLVAFIAATPSAAVGMQAQGRGSTTGLSPNENVIFRGRAHASNAQLTFYPSAILQAIATSER